MGVLLLEIFFKILLFFHILGSICGLGATFASPFIMKGARTVSTAKYAHAVNAKVEKLAKVGSITLLVTGLIMAMIHPYLFTNGWYILSLILYIIVQPVVAYLLPKNAKQMVAILEVEKGEALPNSYIEIAQKTGPLNMLAQVALVILVFLMVFKPF